VRRARLAARLVLLLGVLAQPAALSAQEGVPRVATGVTPDTVLVGEPFRVLVQVEDAEGVVRFDAPAPGDSLHLVAWEQIEGGAVPAAIYEMVAWYPDAAIPATVPFRVTQSDGEEAVYDVPVRLPVVLSVLPAESEPVEPRPARGLRERAESGSAAWPWLLLLLLAALLLALLAAWLLARRRRPHPPAVRDPRRRALERLDALVARGEASPAMAAAFYPAATAILRDYLAAVEPALGRDLTTTELVPRMGAASPSHAAALAALLAHADRVKFARAVPADAEVQRLVTEIRGVIVGFPAPAPEPRETEVAA
jgi:hypothetical protein